jgi:hypothetical protein
MKAQTIQIDSLFISDGEIFPFGPNDTIYGLSISGSVTLLSDTSLVRVILIGEYGEELMVYEAYPMIVDNLTVNFIDESDETYYFDPLMPLSLKFYISDAIIRVDSCHLTQNPIQNPIPLQFQHKLDKDEVKAANINRFINIKGWDWKSDTTSITRFFYSDKKNLFGAKFNLLGFDYYAGGIYFSDRLTDLSIDNSDLTKSFDWRKKHDANLDSTKYWDGCPDKYFINENWVCDENGWVTRIRDQNSSKACNIFSSVASFSTMINLYFNKHLDADYKLWLSEKQVYNCSPWGNGVGCDTNAGKSIQVIHKFFTLSEGDGVITEQCYPWESPYCNGSWTSCEDNPNFLCENPDTVLFIDHFEKTVLDSIEDRVGYIKQLLMDKGPLTIGLHAWVLGSDQPAPHAVSLIGFNTDTETGIIYWILKNSWGPGWGDLGYCTVPFSVYDQIDNDIFAIGLPILAQPPNLFSRIPYDLDYDGYWNWGIGGIPQNFACSNDEDWNDNKNRIGPHDLNYNGTEVKPAMQVCWFKNSFNKDYIENGAFFYFDDAVLANLVDSTFNFRIENPGNAQLNLTAIGAVTGNNSIDYELHTENLDASICMFDGYAEFSIEFLSTITSDNPVDVIRINVAPCDEDVLSDFYFTMVYYDCGPGLGIEPISADETWDGFQFKNKDYRIQPGVTLKVTGIISMSLESDIFIDRGGTLLIDGGKLTGSCNGLWNGVDLWGDRRRPQLKGLQGNIRIINGGTIEFARCGIENAIFDGSNYTYTGGIINAEDAVFKDNLIGVRFWPYHNYNPGTGKPLYNFSKFKNSEFVTSRELYDRALYPQYFIYMLEVEGINILGCNFNNELEKNENPGIGIFSTEADFIVDHYCTVPQTPCLDYIPCRFENLEYGIKSSYITTSESVHIRNSEFTNNITGIYLGVSASPEVTQNVFHVRKTERVPFNESIYCGLYLDRCTGYHVQENFFYTFLDKQQKEDYVSVGLVVNNSGPENNEIYNNTFDGLYTGIIAQEVNRNKEGVLGLQIKCNNFLNGIYDIAVTDNSENITGIAKEQGSPYEYDPAAQAGNRFTYIDPEQDPDPEGNYYNICENITYYYHSDDNGYNIIPNRHSDYPKVNPVLVNNTIFDPQESCRSHISGGVPGIFEEKTNMVIAGQKADSVQNLISLLTDGGNTEALLSEIQNSWPGDGNELYLGLIAESPYLSDTTMVKAVEKENVLIPAMVTDILVANPQSAKSENVMISVDERANPLTDDQLADIGQGRFIIGDKEVLESYKANYLYLENQAKNHLIRLFKADTLFESSIDSIINVLSLGSSLIDEYLKVFEYSKKNDSTNVISTLDDIPLNYILTSSQQNEHELYEDYFEILLSLDTVSSVIFEMDSIQKATLFDIMNNSTGILQGIARNILIINDSLDYVEPIFLPQSGLKSGKVRAWPEKRNDSQNFLKLYPNPAQNIVIIEIRLKENPTNAQLQIINPKGTVLQGIAVNQQNDYIILPISEFNPGFYLCKLSIQNKIVETKQFIISRF